MTRLSLRNLLQGAGEAALRVCLVRWCGAPAGDAKPTLATAVAAMEDEPRVQARLAALPKKLQDLLEPFFAPGAAVRSVQALVTGCGKQFKSRFELEAALATLHREAFVWHVKDKRWSTFDSPSWAVPSELVECVHRLRQRRQRLLQDALTLQGFLDARYFRERAANGKTDGKEDAKASDHARKIYKLYALDASIAQRLQKLPPAVATIVDDVLFKHGGLAAWDETLREVDLSDPPDLALVGKCLGEAMLGTVTDLDLARIGIQPLPQAVVVFHEVVLFALKRRGESAIPPVSEELSCRGDFATNVGRFLKELQQTKVLFTADGDLFKASAKRIAATLLPVPGGFLGQDAALEAIFRFCLQRRLVDRRGERALRPTPAGQDFDRAPLAEQTKSLVAHFVEDRTLHGEPYHHTRLRRVFLRLLRRAEPMVWQDCSLLPFLARNAYLAQLEAAPTEEYFAARFLGGSYTPSESLQQLAWNLLVWVKRRLFPLGVVDLGVHQGRVTALRLSRLGAELLDADPAAKVGGTRSSVIVQPDFEVIVFPGDDVHDVLHLFDRFARRTKSDHVHQFRIDEASVRAGLADGMTGAQIVQVLADRARVPVPQNVRYSLEEWAQRPPA
ncbi:MAG: helicase-associated domain-containing protein [Planctomycetota bacterium]